jgi:hypothetical protein
MGSQNLPERYKPDYDLFILKLVLAHFDVDISEYGFTESGGLGSSGYHEGKADLQFRRATLPTSKWLGGILTRLQSRQLGLPPELEFAFLGLESEDEAAADAIAENRVRSGRMTLNEDRARQGLPPYDFEEANMSLLETQRGLVQIAGFSKLVPAGVLMEPASEHPNVQGDDLDSGNAPAAKPKPKMSMDKAAQEILAYRRWVKKAKPDSRPFRFEHLTAELADQFGFTATSPVEFAKAGDGGPKVTQESVHFRLSMDTQDCGNCVMFHRDTGMCDLGWPTQPQMKCDEWERRPGAPIGPAGSATLNWSPYSPQE